MSVQFECRGQGWVLGFQDFRAHLDVGAVRVSLVEEAHGTEQRCELRRAWALVRVLSFC